MATLTMHTCDIEGCGKAATHLQTKLQVVFVTEQTEGRPTSPHLSNEVLDLCGECLQRIVERHPVVGQGAQGNNTYKLS